MEIKPYPKNAKKHPADQVARIALSIQEFGFNQPIVVDKQGTIIVGHGRYEAAKKLGMEDKDIPVTVVDLTEEQANAYRLADNKLNESDWDMGLVVEELKGLSDHLIQLTGFDLTLNEQKDIEGLSLKDSFEVVVDCVDETEQERVWNELKGNGYKVRVLTY